jgi:2-keto-4-pentenoate hydratase
MNEKDIAKQIRQAYKTKNTIPPIREIIGVKNIDLAYKIQQINTEHKVKKGARITGKKIGLTSLAVQKQLGVDQPDFGVLFNDMEVLNGLSISMSELIQPKAEAEIAFVLGEDLDMDLLTIVDIIGAIDYCLPAIEIVGSRIADWNIKITDTVADNASASHYVLGHTPKTLDEIDVVNCKMEMTTNGEVTSSGTGALCLGSPLNAVLWLAKKMQEVGTPLEAGEVIFSGAIGPMVKVEAGDHMVATFEGLGSVSVSFTE